MIGSLGGVGSWPGFLAAVQRKNKNKERVAARREAPTHERETVWSMEDMTDGVAVTMVDLLLLFQEAVSKIAC